jgi:hypothetical protein
MADNRESRSITICGIGCFTIVPDGRVPIMPPSEAPKAV